MKIIFLQIFILTMSILARISFSYLLVDTVWSIRHTVWTIPENLYGCRKLMIMNPPKISIGFKRIFIQTIPTDFQTENNLKSLFRKIAYATQIVIITLCWFFAILYALSFDQSNKNAWKTNGIIALIADIIFLPISKARVSTFDSIRYYTIIYIIL